MMQAIGKELQDATGAFSFDKKMIQVLDLTSPPFNQINDIDVCPSCSLSIEFAAKQFCLTFCSLVGYADLLTVKDPVLGSWKGLSTANLFP